ncbi:MAG TPA: tetratricopeptide repeat protein [Candidatus Cloacimonadota bacterium]|jgi:tetratricopeptide (TPR) repeat protein|nr:tetratricopeptide repeat protein [Candidatus Cloacimonadota bacterium]HQB40708.1 tetratricopeptide repeat protein [Candidatus Cloacimonadota bacterium]
MKHKLFLIIVSLFFFSLLSATQTNIQLLNQATEAYKSNDFDKALSIYSELEKKIQKNPDIYYNIGNCYFKLNRIGLAILYYKKALVLDSSHALAKKNLNFALKFTLDKQDFENQNFISSFFSRSFFSLSLNALAWVCLILFIALIAIIHVFLRQSESYTHTKKMFLISLVVLNIIFVGWSASRFYIYKNNKEAVISSPKVDAYSGPGESFTKLFTVHEGLILKVIKVDNAWTQISLFNGFTGWIRTSTYKAVAI